MTSLGEVCSAHGTVLLLDTAGEVVHAGWLIPGESPRWVAVREEAGAGLFRTLEQLAVDPLEAEAFVLCEGPGSILGIRTAAVAIRTWQVLRPRAVFGYRSLELLAAARGQPGQMMIADARRQSWHALAIEADGRCGPLQRLAPDQLRPPLVMPGGFRHWSALPATDIALVPYDVPALWADALGAKLLHRSEQPEAFQHEDPQYATWTPRVHQAPRAT